MTYYQVDTRDLDQDRVLKLFRGLLRWAAARGSSFEIRLEPSVYDDSAQLARLRALGDVSTPSPAGDALSSYLRKKFDNDYIVVRGIPGPAFVDETQGSTPESVIVGEQSPVETVVINEGEQPLYIVYDYGTVQILQLSEEQKAEAIKQLAELGYPAGILLPVKGPAVRKNT